MAPELFGVVEDLHGKFARGGDADSANRCGTARGWRGLSEQPLKHGNQKSRRFAGASLGLAGDISACEGKRQGLRLYGRTPHKARFGDPAGDRFDQIKGGKC